VRKALDLPIVGELVYRLNVSRLVVTKMARGHFHSEPNRLSGNRLAAKLAVTHGPAARRGSVRSVSGYLDWIEQPGRASRSRAKGGQAEGCDLRE
jgi:hypothetical protein